jgi:hypothetical protein
MGINAVSAPIRQRFGHRGQGAFVAGGAADEPVSPGVALGRGRLKVLNGWAVASYSGIGCAI